MQDQIRSRELPLVFLGMFKERFWLTKLLLPMFGFSSKLPVTDEQRQWVDEGFSRPEQMLGRRRMLEAVVILPTAEYFPDPYDKSQAAGERLFQRVCTYMRVDRSDIEFQIFPDETEILPYWYGNSGGCAGFYSRDGTADETRMLVAVRSTQLKDPPTEEVYGYALAKFVVERGEENVDWAKHLSTNVQSYFKRSRSWLARNKFQVTLAKPID